MADGTDSDSDAQSDGAGTRPGTPSSDDADWDTVVTRFLEHAVRFHPDLPARDLVRLSEAMYVHTHGPRTR